MTARASMAVKLRHAPVNKNLKSQLPSTKQIPITNVQNPKQTIIVI
jgi:hypothetical protein